jgi:hypothetical protein
VDGKLALRVPDIPRESTGSRDNLVKTVSFILEALHLDKNLVRIVRDPTLGTGFPLPARIERNVDILRHAIRAGALNAGEVITFESGLKGTLPELLACLKAARRNSGLVRKAPAPRRGEIRYTSVELLRKTFNTRFGLDEPGLAPYMVELWKAIFNEVTSPLNSFFPSEWMHSARRRNNVSTDAGIIAKMGYVPTVANPAKVSQSLLCRIEEKTSTVAPAQRRGQVVIGQGTQVTKEVVVDLNQQNAPQGLDYREFRTAVVLTLPSLTSDVRQSNARRARLDPLKVESHRTVEYFKRTKSRKLVDACNLAFAIRSALSANAQKATVAQFRQARNTMLALSANMPFMDSEGVEYARYRDIPESMRKVIESLYPHTMREGDQEQTSESDSDETPAAEETQQPEEPLAD